MRRNSTHRLRLLHDVRVDNEKLFHLPRTQMHSPSIHHSVVCSHTGKLRWVVSKNATSFVGGKSLVTTLVQSESEDCSMTLLQRCVQSARNEGDHMMRELETRSVASAFDSDDHAESNASLATHFSPNWAVRGGFGTGSAVST